MFRLLTIVAVIAALAVSAAPVSAGLLSSPLGVSGRAVLDTGQFEHEWLWRARSSAVYDHGVTQGERRFTVDPQDGATRYVANHSSGTVSAKSRKATRGSSFFGGLGNDTLDTVVGVWNNGDGNDLRTRPPRGLKAGASEVLYEKVVTNNNDPDSMGRRSA